MRNVLKYYYNLTFDMFEEHKNYAVLQSLENIYIFRKVVQEEEDLKNISSILLNNNVPAHLIVYNKDNSLITLFEKEKYVLMKLVNISEDIDKKFLMIPTQKIEVDLADLWSKKIDYYMQQIRELGLGKEILINTFNYYVGMAENAIALYNRTSLMSEEVLYSIAHRRITYPNYSINYYDPTNMVIDVRVRDVAEYSKAKFFSSNYEIDELIDIVYKYNFNNKEVNLLYARLLYPTYFFDIFEDAIIGEEEENKVLKILEKQKEYERFLYDFYQNLKQKYSLYEIEWLKK